VPAFTTSGDAKSIFAYAEGFFAALNHLQLKSTPAEFEVVVWPFMTLSAFASELYFKSIIRLETDRTPRGHYLHELFLKVSPTTQRIIEKKWDALVLNRVDILQKLDQAFPHPVPRDLATTLKEGNKGFELLRYAYEPGNAGFRFLLGDLPVALRRAILELQPAWGAPDTLSI
jgi:HEPN domain-containing protein